MNIFVGTSVYANVWGPLHDPEVYPEPEKFKADRFLDGRGNFCSPDPKYFPVFSAGKRFKTKVMNQRYIWNDEVLEWTEHILSPMWLWLVK